MPRLLYLLLIASLLLTASAPSAMAQSGEPTREPVLRIETGMRTASIRRIGVDAANRYLVTASDDKTVRGWELPTDNQTPTTAKPQTVPDFPVALKH